MNRGLTDTGSRPTDRVPKPNTRFLKNIIRDTDAHNANLKRKEEQEARGRMRQLRRDDTGERSNRHAEREPKRRRVESPRERHRRSHRSRDDEREGSPSVAYSKSSEYRRHREKERDRYERDDAGSERRSRAARPARHRDDDKRKEERHNRGRRRHRERDDSRHRSKSPDKERGDDTGEHGLKSQHSRSPRRRKRQSRSRCRHRSRDRDDERRKHKRSHHPHRPRSATPPKAKGYTNPAASRHTPPARKHDTKTHQPPSSRLDPDQEHDHAYSDDDPLSNLIGPLPPSANDPPPIRSRGRGAYKNNKSNIDAHFAAEYDPGLDVHLHDNEDDEDPSAKPNPRSIRPRPVPGLTAGGTDDIENDWDMALEALRDRARWRRAGADRLREAGFEESVVDKFVNNRVFGGLDGKGKGGGGNDDGDRDVADVRWAKKGEGREWDRGKVLDDEGHVDIKAPW